MKIKSLHRIWDRLHEYAIDNCKVWKRGCKTLLTRGFISEFNGYTGYNTIDSDEPGKAFSEPGDSGSIIFLVLTKPSTTTSVASVDYLYISYRTINIWWLKKVIVPSIVRCIRTYL